MTPTPLKRRPVPADSLEAASTLLDRNKVADKLGVTPWTLNSWIKSGRFPKPELRITESAHRWRLSTVLQWIERTMREPHKAPRLRGQAKRWGQPRRHIPRVRLHDHGDRR